jgi:hypothetical protein
MGSQRDCASSRSISSGLVKAVPSNSCGSEPWAGPAACPTRYRRISRILSDHTISHRPDCALRCNEQTAFCIMIAHFKLDDRLSVLRTEDRFRTWRSLDDERLCIICKRKFDGRQVEIRRLGNHKYQLHCPTEGCNSRPDLWIYPSTPLVSHVVESDWWRAAGKQKERRAPESTLRAQGHRV